MDTPLPVPDRTGSPPEPSAAPPRGAARRFVLLVGALAVAAGAAVLLGPPDTEALRSLVDRFGSVGPVAAVAGYALGILLVVPRTALSIAAGLLFGFTGGAVYALAGTLIGATAGFAVGRLLGRDYVDAKLAAWAESGPRARRAGARAAAAAWIRHRLALADRWLARRGLLGMWMVRTIPVAHFGITSYACGTASVRYRHYILGTLIGSTPGAVGYAAVGASVLGSGGLPLALGIAMLLSAVSLGTATLARRRAAAGTPTPAPEPARTA